MVMVYRVADVDIDTEASTCFATKEYARKTKAKVGWDDCWDIQPGRLDALGRYFPQQDPFAPAWSKFG